MFESCVPCLWRGGVAVACGGFVGVCVFAGGACVGFDVGVADVPVAPEVFVLLTWGVAGEVAD